ncbi:Glutamate--tRNA ligase mitochondrial [Puccinia graminis f. sp. tritici]|uniref:Glutamate--tRNA ligase, mitochondrial n=1 Tax=Puccinia graminis f. sp. tritici TaxID=56615 RepID=A0A5B0RW67_PUCGR|nr:Glutamate--tRNA ligase mitochondrial [Puccinia graminis f. sp. tritici]
MMRCRAILPLHRLSKQFFGTSTRRTAHSEQPVRLRFAPSPTGYLHLGGLRTALFNHLLARKLRGKWILRIEDTDQSRLVDGAVESIIETLEWAKLDYDEGPNRPGECGPYIQSQRQTIYQAHRDQLLQSGQAYRCFCSPDRLDQMRQEFRSSGSNLTYDRKCLQLSEAEVTEKMSRGLSHVIRLKNSDNPVSVDDLVYGQLTFKNNTQDDVILIKADGTPTYHFANVVDDHHMGISHVLRGEEWLSSTPKHILLYNAFGFPLPRFAHLPLLVNADGSKLSKRSGDVRVEDYIAKGYEPEALLNFVALMGMNHSRHTTDEGKNENTTTDVMTMEQMVSAFSIDVIGKHRSTMSQPKLVHLNQQHIARNLLSTEPDQVQPWITRARSILLCGPARPEVSDAYVHRVLLAMKDRLHVFNDIKYLAEYFFKLPDLSSSEAREMRKNIPDELYHRILDSSHQMLSELPEEETGYEREKVAAGLKQVREADPELSSKQVMVALRHAITGRKIGPGMAETIGVLGKKRTLERIEAALR